MIDPTQPSPTRDSSLIEDLLARCLECGPGERTAELQRLCAENPREADELRRRYAALAALGLDVSAADESRRDVPERLGDFRILAELGGGGMGVVYRAEQVSLGREVALKLIRPEHLFFPSARERFRREVTAVAQLAHPNIVPVYTVGEEDGLPYFAMELVRGCTLAQVLADLADRAPESLTGADLARVVAARSAAFGSAGSVVPGGEPVPDGERESTFAGSWPDAGLRLVRQIADALEHAHGRGIIHRDVKPSNIALTPDGRALLLDFGLTSSASGDRVTRTGGTVGTPAYMSPEQVRGAEVDAITDVYSLGVTLYELLTLTSPFRARSEQAIKELILDGRAPAPRGRNARVSADVQTVCQHAMDRDAARRYGSARALLRDVDNLLARRPIEASPPGPVLRTRRWIQRHPTLTAALVLGLALVGGLPTALLIQARAHGEELATKADELAAQTEVLERTAAERERQAAELLTAADALEEQRNAAHREARSAEAALDFLLRMLTRAQPEIARGKPPTVADLLDETTAALATALPDEPAIRARLLFEIGARHAKSDRYLDALPLLDEAIALLDPPADEKATDWIAQARHHRGHVLLRLGRLPEAEADLLAVLDYLADAPREMRAATWNELIEIYKLQGRLAEAETLLRRNVEIFEAWDDARPEDRWGSVHNLATLVWERGRRAEAFELEVAAVQGMRATLPSPDPMLASTIGNLGQMLRLAGGLDEAEPWLLEALAMKRTMWPFDHPQVAHELHMYARLLFDRGELERALHWHAEATRMLAAVLPDGHPKFVDALTDYKQCLLRLGGHRAGSALLPALIETQRSALPRSAQQLGESLAQQGDVLAGEQRHAEAACHFLEAAEHLADRPGQEQLCVRSLNEAARALLALDRPHEAQQPLARAARVLFHVGRLSTSIAADTRRQLLAVEAATGHPVPRDAALAALLDGPR